MRCGQQIGFQATEMATFREDRKRRMTRKPVDLPVTFLKDRKGCAPPARSNNLPAFVGVLK